MRSVGIGGMADGEEKDLYSVLGLGKACSNVELKSAYKKLAMRWHPDRCYGYGDSSMEEAKSKFQEIRGAYSVLSDTNKRWLYDIGVYQSDDEDHEMGDFLDELATMMSKTAPCPGTPQESFAELQSLFMEMFETEVSIGSAPFPCRAGKDGDWAARNGPKRDGADMFMGRSGSSIAPTELSDLLNSSGNAFCFGQVDSEGLSGGGERRRRRDGRKHKVSSRRDVSSGNTGVFGS